MEERTYCCYHKKHGCYFEFQSGNYFDEETHWLDSSLFIAEDIVNEYRLGIIFRNAIPEFHYFGPTVVTKEQWQVVKDMSGDGTAEIKKIIHEIDEWAENCFLTENCFSICGV